LQKYDMVVQTLIQMGVDIVYPVELPPQSSLNLDGKNSFEPIVCMLPVSAPDRPRTLLVTNHLTRFGVQGMLRGLYSSIQGHKSALTG
jgi:hypothetical protein